MTAWVPEDETVDVPTKTVVWFGSLGLLYALYVWSFYVTDGFSAFRDFSRWRLLQKVVLVALPIGITYLWAKRRLLIPLDYHLVYAPFAVWGLAFYLAGRDKGLSNAFVELQIVALLSGLYLLRFSLEAMLPETNSTRIAVGLFLMVLLASFFVPFLIPVLPD
jgi:hypothetical protein